MPYAIITGASGGIGLCLARELASRKYDVLLVARSEDKLAQAVVLNRDAALQSCSWGRFQVLGLNWKSLKYESLQEFINCMS